ncbi:MAG: protein kinase [Symploca sp. SIO3E6]|nr:protein kinase [Caldora sp. SIO3E6]
MIYCINPECKHRQNSEQLDYCSSCGTSLLINGRYRLIKPLRELSPFNHTDIWEVDDGGTRKVLKVLKDNNPQLVEMFAREALTLQELKHSGIPQVDIDGYFTFTPNHSSPELHCLVMEYIKGQNLEQWISEHGSISQTLALQWLRELIEILAILHQNHFFHRDLKPANIMLKPDGQLVLIDFGSVRQLSHTYLAKLNLGNLTTVFSGGYTPQEQLDGKASPLSDYFALGRTFVYLLTGKHPVEFSLDSKTGKLIWQEQARHIASPLRDFIDELMAPFPGDRPQNTSLILRYLHPRGLFFKTVLRLLNSPKFKLMYVGLLTLGVTSAIIYRASFPSFAQQYYEQGVKELNENQLDKARKYFEKALSYNPKDDRIYNNLGVICQRQKDFTCVKSMYEQALQLNSSNTVARYNLAGFYDDSGDLKRAEVEYQLAAQSESPVAANAISDWARVRILQGDTAQAIALSFQGLQQTDNPRVQSALHKNLGWGLWMETRDNEAEVHLRRAIELNEQRTDAYCLLAQVLESLGKKEEALVEWENCLHHNSKNRVEVLTWQTMARQRLKGVGED